MLQRALAALLIAGLCPLPGVPASARATTLTVDVTTDTYDGSCSDGDCSLRDAVASAADTDTVALPSGFYPLTAVEAGGGASDGPVEIVTPMTIRGVGETGAFIDASALGSTPFIVRSDVEIRDVTVFGAEVAGRAGVAEVGGPAVSILRLRHVTITGGMGTLAGALFVGSSGAVSIRGSLFLSNRSIAGSGAIRLGRGGLWANVANSSFLENRGRNGGAMSGGPFTLRSVTLSRNIATAGGGAIKGYFGEWSQLTITGNRAHRGGAISITDPEGRPSVGHTVIAGNVSARGGQCDGRSKSLGWNVESRTGCGFTATTDQRGVDPGLRPVTSNGGPTPTASIPPGSVALDVGGSCSFRDQRGAPRDGPCDAGAYERVLCRGRAVDIVGTPGDDDLSGGREPDTFLGLGGDDEFQGSLDRDRACGGAGDDHLIGGPAEDVLVGGAGNDVLDGEGGLDRCRGGPGRDRRVDCEG